MPDFDPGNDTQHQQHRIHTTAYFIQRPVDVLRFNAQHQNISLLCGIQITCFVANTQFLDQFRAPVFIRVSRDNLLRRDQPPG